MEYFKDAKLLETSPAYSWYCELECYDTLLCLSACMCAAAHCWM